MKTIAIVGAGPGLGLSIAKTFGKNGFRVALIARRRESLDQMVATLQSHDIEAKGFVADVRDEPSIINAFSAIKAQFGSVDVLEYSPISMEFIPPSQVTTQIARKAFEFQVLGAVASVQQFLPDMIKNQNGAILLTGGRSSVVPMAFIGSLSPMAAALRNYAYILNEELAEKGIYAGTMTICCQLTPEIVDRIAALYWDMYQKRNRVEEIFGENIRIEKGFPVRF
ncbi:MAG: SDR family NAD(P)-dependent oxidoreductase [Dehalococcoidia bacterium]|nr:SDR family NAD(P)-dependent oxidoreductase [Dehalococcoidia bacterium]